MSIFLNAEHNSDYLVLLNNAFGRNDAYLGIINYKCYHYKLDFYSSLKAIELYHYLLEHRKNYIISSVYPNATTSKMLYPDYNNTVRLNFIHKMMVDEDLSASAAMRKYKSTVNESNFDKLVRILQSDDRYNLVWKS